MLMHDEVKWLANRPTTGFLFNKKKTSFEIEGSGFLMLFLLFWGVLFLFLFFSYIDGL